DRFDHLLQDSPPGTAVEHTPLHLWGDEPKPHVHGSTRPDSSDMSTMPGSSGAGDKLETLEVRGLTCIYPGSDLGIRDVSFSLRRGDFVVITGRIGSGK